MVDEPDENDREGSKTEAVMNCSVEYSPACEFLIIQTYRFDDLPCMISQRIPCEAVLTGGVTELDRRPLDVTP